MGLHFISGCGGVGARLLNTGKSARQDEAITKSLTYFIAEDMIIFRIVERSGFKELMRTDAPQYSSSFNCFSLYCSDY